MKHFYIKILIAAVFITLGAGICAKLVFFTNPVHFDREAAYDTASWLSKHNITISKEIIDTAGHYVYETELVSIASDKDRAAALILGEDMKKSAADTYIGESGTLVFSLMSFELTVSDEYKKSEWTSVDKYNAPKLAEKFIKSSGINLSGSAITANQTENGYSVSIVKTIDSLPVFNDVITVSMSDKGIDKADGVWYYSSDAQKSKRRAKSSIDALGEYLRSCGGAKKEITSLELGYTLDNINEEKAKIIPVWRIIDSDGTVSFINA